MSDAIHDSVSESDDDARPARKRAQRTLVRDFQPPTMQPASVGETVKLLAMFMLPFALLMLYGWLG